MLYMCEELAQDCGCESLVLTQLLGLPTSSADHAFDEGIMRHSVPAAWTEFLTESDLLVKG